jgi:hypothetical protein
VCQFTKDEFDFGGTGSKVTRQYKYNHKAVLASFTEGLPNIRVLILHIHHINHGKIEMLQFVENNVLIICLPD